MSAGQSYGSERYYYFYDDKQEFITDCQKSDQVYPHQIEITGWQPHDDQLFAYALSTVYIEGTPQGRYNIKTSEVLPGTAQTPYTYDGESTAPTNEISYEDCTKYQGQNRVKNYTRPDGTKYSLVVGEADPVSQGDVCSVQISWGPDYHDQFENSPQNYQVVNKCGSYTFMDYSENRGSFQATDYYHCSWTLSEGTKTIVRDDGETIGAPVTKACRSAPKQFIRTEPDNPDFVRRISWYGGWSYPPLTAIEKNNCTVTWGWQ
jgi:hypothetical protein